MKAEEDQEEEDNQGEELEVRSLFIHQRRTGGGGNSLEPVDNVPRW